MINKHTKNQFSRVLEEVVNKKKGLAQAEGRNLVKIEARFGAQPNQISVLADSESHGKNYYKPQSQGM